MRWWTFTRLIVGIVLWYTVLFLSCSVVSDLCDPMDCSSPGFPVLSHLLEFAQIHVHRVGDAIQPSHPLSPPSPPVLKLLWGGVLYTLNLYSAVCQLLLSKTGKIFKKHKRINRTKKNNRSLCFSRFWLDRKNSYIHWIFYCCLFTKSCLIFCNPMDCSPPGSSVHGISQARILKWVAVSFSRGSSWPWDQTCISCISSCVLYCRATGEAHVLN